ncbi:DUF6431 domain-containing protein [Lachnospiraceae bacterium OttesenSCG-928-D06]|nr:DUF6431 domain-containing protein [Lachnospiraceae bacterium OttesenSCG-928-D06]
MIIDFTHTFNSYNEILYFYGIWEYSCPKCGAMHSFHRHGKYVRNLIVKKSDDLVEERMEILRLQCGSCKSTHAVLTPDIIPFGIFSSAFFLSLITLCLCPKGSVLKAQQKTGISYQLLYRFLQIFQEYYHKLILLLRREALWTHTEHPLAEELLGLLCSKPPPWFAFHFFIHFQMPLFLHRRNTISYPLFFGTHSS